MDERFAGDAEPLRDAQRFQRHPRSEMRRRRPRRRVTRGSWTGHRRLIERLLVATVQPRHRPPIAQRQQQGTFSGILSGFFTIPGFLAIQDPFDIFSKDLYLNFQLLYRDFLGSCHRIARILVGCSWDSQYWFQDSLKALLDIFNISFLVKIDGNCNSFDSFDHCWPRLDNFYRFELNLADFDHLLPKFYNYLPFLTIFQLNLAIFDHC